MRNKLMAVCVVLASSIAVAVMPATATATNSPMLKEGLNNILTGERILATSEGTVYFRSSSEPKSSILVECETARMTGTVTKNDGSNIESTIETASFLGNGKVHEGACGSTFGEITVTTSPLSGFGTPLCLRSTSFMATDEFQLRGNSCSSAARSITFVLDSTMIGECRYERSTLTGPVRGTFTTAITKATIAAQEIRLESGSFLCPSKLFLFMSFTIELDESPYPMLSIV